jgi:hypothetical protein
VDADKERNLGIILLEPNGSLIPASEDSQVTHMFSCMPLTGTQKKKVKHIPLQLGSNPHYYIFISSNHDTSGVRQLLTLPVEQQ